MESSVVAAYGQSDVGKVRSDNQDALRIYEPEGELIETQGFLYGIADGMGGYEHGGIASTVALETFFSTFQSDHSSKVPQKLRKGVESANLAVYQTAQRHGARMGTTLSAINLIGHQLHLAHIGDSRVYLVRGRKALCLTNDHTAVGELVRMKLLSPDKVRTHERRSVLEKCLGMQLFIQPDISTHMMSENDTLILCSDGVWAYVQDDEFAALAVKFEEPEPISKALINLALERESDDNVSALVVHIHQLAPMSATALNPGRGITQIVRGLLTGRA